MRERSTFIHSKRQRPEKKQRIGSMYLPTEEYRIKAFKSGINFAMRINLQNSVTQF